MDKNKEVSLPMYRNKMRESMIRKPNLSRILNEVGLAKKERIEEGREKILFRII